MHITIIVCTLIYIKYPFPDPTQPAAASTRLCWLSLMTKIKVLRVEELNKRKTLGTFTYKECSKWNHLESEKKVLALIVLLAKT